MCGLSASSASHMLLRRDLYTIAAHEVLQIPEGTTRERDDPCQRSSSRFHFIQGVGTAGRQVLASLVQESVSSFTQLLALFRAVIAIRTNGAPHSLRYSRYRAAAWTSASGR